MGTGEVGCCSVTRSVCGAPARDLSSPAFRGDGKSILLVGVGVRSSTSIGTCWVPRNRAGEDWMARWSATAAAESSIRLVAMRVTACALEGLGRPVGGNCGECAPSGSCGSSSGASIGDEASDGMVNPFDASVVDWSFADFFLCLLLPDPPLRFSS